MPEQPDPDPRKMSRAELNAFNLVEEHPGLVRPAGPDRPVINPDDLLSHAQEREARDKQYRLDNPDAGTGDGISEARRNETSNSLYDAETVADAREILDAQREPVRPSVERVEGVGPVFDGQPPSEAFLNARAEVKPVSKMDTFIANSRDNQAERDTEQGDEPPEPWPGPNRIDSVDQARDVAERLK